MTDLAPSVIVTAGRMQCNVAYWLRLLKNYFEGSETQH